jgi:acyl dehydratase
MAGLYYEEFAVGMEFRHALRRTVTEMDNVMFCALTHNPQPLHLDEEFAKGTEFGQRIVNSLFTLGLVIGVTVVDTTLGTTIGNLGMTDIRFKHPVFHGDTIRAVTRIRDKRESKSRPDAGLVVFEHAGYNQREQEIAYVVRTGLMRKRPA